MLRAVESADSNSDAIADCDPTWGCEESASWTLLLLLSIILLCVVVIYLLLRSKFQYIPESTAVIALGVIVGLIVRLSGRTVAELLTFSPETFFLYLLPPIIFDSGYSLHKSYFFRNLGPILLFAVFGTLISTMIVGVFTYLFGLAGISYGLSLLDSMIFGSLISAVDPVATLAVFHALHVDETLNILVFGESVLNDAVAIVLYRTFLGFEDSSFAAIDCLIAVGEFLLVSFGSVFIGISTGLLSALLFKYTNLKEYPSLELTLMYIFSYYPYVLAEGLELSGIMAILFCGIVMAHYTHFNLSAASQIATAQSFHMLAFLAETTVFVYLGMSVFTFNHNFRIGLVLWTLLLILIGRAANIFPLAFLCNRVRSIEIPTKYQFIMWFSGLRGAIAFALALNLPSDNSSVLGTTTLVVVLFTIVVFGGGTLPMLRLTGIKGDDDDNVPKSNSGSNTEGLSISRTFERRDMDETASEDDDEKPSYVPEGWFERLDGRWLKPIFRAPCAARLNHTTSLELQGLSASWNLGHDSDEEDHEARGGLFDDLDLVHADEVFRLDESDESDEEGGENTDGNRGESRFGDRAEKLSKRGILYSAAAASSSSGSSFPFVMTDANKPTWDTADPALEHNLDDADGNQSQGEDGDGNRRDDEDGDGGGAQDGAEDVSLISIIEE